MEHVIIRTLNMVFHTLRSFDQLVAISTCIYTVVVDAADHGTCGYISILLDYLWIYVLLCTYRRHPIPDITIRTVKLY